MKDKKTKSTTNIDAGIASGAGAAVGTMAGNAFAQKAQADSRPVPEPECEVQVLNYETVTHESGDKMDVAVVSVDGQPLALIDTDLNGEADVMAVDSNLDGVAQEEELCDVTAEHIRMEPFRSALGLPENGELALVEDDYVNDADVHEFMG